MLKFIVCNEPFKLKDILKTLLNFILNGEHNYNNTTDISSKIDVK